VNACSSGGLFCAVALDVATELDDQAVMNHPIDGGSGRQRVLEDLTPLRKDKV